MAIRARGGGPPPGLDRISGPDRSGTAFAVVDAVGRFVDISLQPGWWEALGQARVAAGLIEALETARMKAALVPMILRRHGYRPSSPPEGRHRRESPHEALPPPGDEGFMDAARGRIAEAYRLIDDADKRLRDRHATRIFAGPRGLFHLHVRGGRIEWAEVTGVTPADTDRLVADVRAALTELTMSRGEF